MIMTVALGLICSAATSSAEPWRPAHIFFPNVRLGPGKFPSSKKAAKAQNNPNEDATNAAGIVRSAIAERLAHLGETVVGESDPGSTNWACLDKPTHACIDSPDLPKDASVLWGKIEYSASSCTLKLRFWKRLPSGSLDPNPKEGSVPFAKKCTMGNLLNAVMDAAGHLVADSPPSEPTAGESPAPSEPSSAPKSSAPPASPAPVPDGKSAAKSSSTAPPGPSDAAGGPPLGASPASDDHPRLARAVLGLTWGGFVLATGAMVSLFAVNRSDYGALETDGYRVNHVLTPATWTALAATAVTLTIAIPTTVLTRRARSR